MPESLTMKNYITRFKIRADIEANTAEFTLSTFNPSEKKPAERVIRKNLDECTMASPKTVQDINGTPVSDIAGFRKYEVKMNEIARTLYRAITHWNAYHLDVKEYYDAQNTWELDDNLKKTLNDLEDQYGLDLTLQAVSSKSIFLNNTITAAEYLSLESDFSGMIILSNGKSSVWASYACGELNLSLDDIAANYHGIFLKTVIHELGDLGEKLKESILQKNEYCIRSMLKEKAPDVFTCIYMKPVRYRFK